jgi:pimeloyl-ACP methyl ester carboxylesterase
MNQSEMINPRKYGKPPYNVAVIHGGPGACGEMAPVARELAFHCGVLEPMQKAGSLQGQVDELMSFLKKHSDLPVILIGFSWGAWLSYMVAARNPDIIKKLILIGSGPFEEKYTTKIQKIREKRLSQEQKTEFQSILSALNDPYTQEKNAFLSKLGELATMADAYDPIFDVSEKAESMEFQGDTFQSVWNEAAEFRKNGELLELGKRIRCPLTIIHGDFDPHPVAGVINPLSLVLNQFNLILLRNCGHKPWIEKQARETFYLELKEAIH